MKEITWATEESLRLSRAFLAPFAINAADDANADLNLDKPVDDAVETTKTLYFHYEDTVTYIEFTFGGKDCTVHTLVSVTLFSNYGSPDEMWKYKYKRDESVKLFDKYAKYLED